MRTSNLKPSSLPFNNVWSDLRLDRAKRDVYARIADDPGLSRFDRHKLVWPEPRRSLGTPIEQIHGVSSPCGNSASSLTWYVERPVHRLQGRMLVWLYRCGLKNGANIPEALIAVQRRS